MARPNKRHTNRQEGLVYTSLVSLCPESTQNRANQLKSKEIKLKVKPERFQLPFESNSSVLVILENQNEFTVSYAADTTSPISLTIDPKDGCIAPGKKAQITVSRAKKMISIPDEERLVFNVKGCVQCNNGYSNDPHHQPTKRHQAPPRDDSRKRRHQLHKTRNGSKKLKAYPEIECQTYTFPTIPNEYDEYGIAGIASHFIAKQEDSQPVDFKLWDNIDSYRGFQGNAGIELGDDLDASSHALYQTCVNFWDNNTERASPEGVDQYGRRRNTFVGQSSTYNDKNEVPVVVESYYSNSAVKGSPGESRNDDDWDGPEGFQFTDNGRAGSFVADNQFHRSSERQPDPVYYDQRDSGCQDYTDNHRNSDRQPEPPTYYDNGDSGCQDYTDNHRNSDRQPDPPTYYDNKNHDYTDNQVDQWYDSPKDIDYQHESKPSNNKAFRKRPTNDIVVDQPGLARRIARRMTSIFVPFQKTSENPAVAEEVKCDCKYCTKRKRPVLKIAIKNKKDSASTKLNEEGFESRRKKLKYVLVISILTVVTVFAVMTYYEDYLVVPYFRLVERSTFWEEYVRSFRE